MIMCAFTVNAFTRFAPLRPLIFTLPSIPIRTSDRTLAIVPLLAFPHPLSPILPDIHHAVHPLRLLGHGVSIFCFEQLPSPDPSFRSAKAFIDAGRNDLARFRLPYIGAIAERWLSEE